jgi:hypothetical protein
MRVELLCTPVDALPFEETVARAGEPMTQRGGMVQVSQNVAKVTQSPKYPRRAI